MENLLIEKGTKTPAVEFTTKGELRIEGRSLPENPFEFYEQPLNWLKKFAAIKPKEVSLHVALEYYNTASSKLLFDIFKQLEEMKMHYSKIDIYWHCEEKNENILDAGDDFKSILKVPFHIVTS